MRALALLLLAWPAFAQPLWAPPADLGPLEHIVTPPWPLCLSSRDGQPRRWVIAHQREDHEWEISCAYGPAWSEVAEEWRGMP